MAITKKYLKSKPVCKVTLELDGVEASKIVAVGNFNDWNAEANPMKKFKNGKFKTTIDLEKDNTYEFRYIVDGVYMNDSGADSYLWNDFAGAENGVLSV